VLRYVEVLEAYMSAQVIPASGHANVLAFVPLDPLNRCALDLP
jgi:uncharacterized protein (DUF2237 family)